MAYNYTDCDRDQQFLLPPSLRDWLPEEHFAWFLLDAIAQMDLSSFHAAHRIDGKGQKAHHPEIMLAVLLYRLLPGRTLESPAGATVHGERSVSGPGGQHGTVRM